jgi:DNA-3-methyladenine glycosylase II
VGKHGDISQVPVRGPFDLAIEREHFGGWPSPPDEPGAVAMAFPVDGTESSALVLVRQDPGGPVTCELPGCPPELRDAALAQALAVLSLDVDGESWPAVGERDRLIGELQARYGFLRPVLFHSPYEAAAAFIIGHRISIRQGRATRARMAIEAGSPLHAGGAVFHAFPTPSQLLAAASLPGVSTLKHERLRAVAVAAREGMLARSRLRALPTEAALSDLRSLPGIGPFFAEGILLRGAGFSDALASDQVTRFAVSQRYGLPPEAAAAELPSLAESWRPLRMWTTVLLHAWVRTEVGLPGRERR